MINTGTRILSLQLIPKCGEGSSILFLAELYSTA